MLKHQQIQQSKKADTNFQKQAAPIKQSPLPNPMAIIQQAKINPKSLTHADVMQLQRTIGNRAVGRLLSEIGLVPSTAKPVQRQEIPEEEEPLQTKKENNTGMTDNLKAGMENLSGIDMSNARVHYNSSKPSEIGALVYTQMTNVHVAPGQDKHLPHEVWSVVQQAQERVQPTMQMRGVAVNNEVGLKREADVMGMRTIGGSHRGILRKRVVSDILSSNQVETIQKSIDYHVSTDIPVSKKEGTKNYSLETVEVGLKNPSFMQEKTTFGSETAVQGKVVQFMPKSTQKPRVSVRIATKQQEGVRKNRSKRKARKNNARGFRYAPEAHTSLISVPALGGGYGLNCPPGSYYKMQRGFEYTGSRRSDFANLGGTPRKKVWHHHHDFKSTGINKGHGTMYLLSISQHLPGHYGGVHQWNETAGNTPYTN